jgi:hypothetical protein
MNGSERDVSDEKCRKRVLCILACSGQALICNRNVGGGIWAWLVSPQLWRMQEPLNDVNPAALRNRKERLTVTKDTP